MSKLRSLVMCLFAVALLAAAPRAVIAWSFHSFENYGSPHVASQSYCLDFAGGQWQAIIAAGDGKTYFFTTSHKEEGNAQFFLYDPMEDEVRHLKDVGIWTGQTEGIGEIETQGAVVAGIVEVDGVLYTVTDKGRPPETYRGGHFIGYDTATGEFHDLGRYENTGGMTAICYEPVHRRLYAFSEGDPMLVYYDLDAGRIIEAAPMADVGREVSDMIADGTGNVYGSTAGSRIFRYEPEAGVTVLELRVPSSPSVAVEPEEDPGSLGWRQTKWKNMLWDEETGWWYGIRGADEYLFRFRPAALAGGEARIEGLHDIGREPARRANRYGSFGIARFGRNIYYAPHWGSQAHLVSYNIDTGEFVNYGKIAADHRRFAAELHSLVVGSDYKLHGVGMVPSARPGDPQDPSSMRRGFYVHSRFLKIDVKRDLKRMEHD